MAEEKTASPSETAAGSSARAVPGVTSSTPTARTPAPAAPPQGPEAATADEIESPLAVHEEVTEAGLRHAPRGRATATGLKAIEESEIERIEAVEDRGGNEDLIGEAPEKGDYLGEPAENSEAQGLSAGFAANGAVDSRMVASPSGPQPVSTVAHSREEAEARLVEQRRRELNTVRRRTSELQRIPDDLIRTMTGAEARAVLEDRGYANANETMTYSNRAARERLIKAQNEDERFAEQEQDDEE